MALATSLILRVAAAGWHSKGETADSGCPLVGSPSTGTLGVIPVRGALGPQLDLTRSW